MFSLNCRCADRIIEYLEREKWEYVPKKLTPQQREDLRIYKENMYRDIDNVPYFSLSKKEELKHEVIRQLFFDKVRKDFNKQ